MAVALPLDTIEFPMHPSPQLIYHYPIIPFHAYHAHRRYIHGAAMVVFGGAMATARLHVHEVECHILGSNEAVAILRPDYGAFFCLYLCSFVDQFLWYVMLHNCKEIKLIDPVQLALIFSCYIIRGPNVVKCAKLFHTDRDGLLVELLFLCQE